MPPDDARLPRPTLIDLLAEAVALHRAGDLVAAEQRYHAVLDREPEQSLALHMLGALCLTTGRATAAVPLLEAALRDRAGHAGLWATLALARLAKGAPAEALTAARQAIRLAPDAAEPRFAEGASLRALHRAREAVTALRAAIAAAPGHAAAHLALGNALLDTGAPDSGEAALRQALALDPGLAEGWASLGCALADAGRPDEAIAACDTAIRLRPDFAEAHWNRGVAHLLAGDFARGWQDYEWRKRHPRHAAAFRRLPTREWQGETLEGHRLLVLAEQGLGDAIQFARFVPELAARGAAVLLACATPLLGLLDALPGLAGITDRAAAPPPHDLWVDQMSLPRLLGTRPATIPGAAGYLPCPRRRSGPGRRIGLVWAGNPLHSNDARRSVPLAALAPLLAEADLAPGLTRDLSWVSLQHGPRGAEGAGHGLPAPDLPDFAATAALVAGLDLVIAADTSTAHLAGAMGVPVWLMLPHAPDWRWMTGRADTPWYASMRLFRQPAPGDWNGVVAALGAALAARYPTRSRPASHGR
ncbi:MAG: tetratricopeptide repeat protein [Rhodospirillales bacterium]|nr:tetratricopeptide repeat protein [Rhodospirillales bacterium]